MRIPLKLFIALLTVLAATLTYDELNAADDMEYAGSKTCQSCHGQIYDKWASSDHFWSMRPADRNSIRGDFEGGTVEFHGIESTFSRKDGGYFIETLGDRGRQTYRISYTFGHSPLQQYLVETEQGRLQALNLAWDTRAEEAGGQRWFHLQPDEDIEPSSPLFWTRHLMNWNSRCADCHSTNVRKNYDVDADAYKTTFSEVNVGCEACHGPAGHHVASEGYDTTRLIKAPSTLQWKYTPGDAIANPTGIKSSAQLDMCGGCHARRSVIDHVQPGRDFHSQYSIALLGEGLYHVDGQIQDEVFVLGSFLQSRMHDAGVVCSDCHDPHDGEPIYEGNALCAGCHQSSVYDVAAHHGHEPAVVSCVDCHMPETTYMLVDGRRDHRFGIPDPQLAHRYGVPNVCESCHGKEVVLSPPERIVADEFTELNHRVRLGDRLVSKEASRYIGNPLNPVIKRATLLAHLPGEQNTDGIVQEMLDDESPLLRAAAVNALQIYPPDIRWRYLKDLTTDPMGAVRFEAGRVASRSMSGVPLTGIGTFTELIDEYREGLSVSLDMPSGQTELGLLELNLGKFAEAERAFRRALTIEPHYLPALLNLADLHRASGEEEDARKQLIKALEVAPDNSAANHSYALALVRSGQTEAALTYFKRAADQPDSEPRYAYVYAVALDSLSMTDQALNVLARAVQRWPNQADLLELQAIYRGRQNRR